nr:integrase arm-type DNA-binding domain-containing protein [Allgaiera indica]
MTYLHNTSSRKGAKTFALSTRGHDGRKLNLKLGDYPAIGLKMAHEVAQTHLQAIAQAKEPRRPSKGN